MMPTNDPANATDITNIITIDPWRHAPLFVPYVDCVGWGEGAKIRGAWLPSAGLGGAPIYLSIGAIAIMTNRSHWAVHRLLHALVRRARGSNDPQWRPLLRRRPGKGAR